MDCDYFQKTEDLIFVDEKLPAKTKTNIPRKFARIYGTSFVTLYHCMLFLVMLY